jgi:hypothetical protein
MCALADVSRLLNRIRKVSTGLKEQLLDDVIQLDV